MSCKYLKITVSYGQNTVVYKNFREIADSAAIINNSLEITWKSFSISIRKIEDGFFQFLISFQSKLQSVNTLETIVKNRITTELTLDDVVVDNSSCYTQIPQLVGCYLFLNPRLDLKAINNPSNVIELASYYDEFSYPILNRA